MRFISTDGDNFVVHDKGLYEMVSSEIPPFNAKLVRTDNEVDWVGAIFGGPSVVIGSEDSREVWLYTIRKELVVGEESKLFEETFTIAHAASADALAHRLNAQLTLWESSLVVYMAKLVPTVLDVSIQDL